MFKVPKVIVSSNFKEPHLTRGHAFLGFGKCIKHNA
jgi:hypothetical protein